MKSAPKPPKAYEEFIERYPKLGQAWDLIHAAGVGPLDDKTARPVKLGIAIGAMRDSAIHSSVRKALAQGIAPACNPIVTFLSRQPGCKAARRRPLPVWLVVCCASA